MKILMLARATLYSSPGGDTIQINSTAEHLRTLGVEVDIKCDDKRIEYSSYDLMHFFNIIRPDDIIPHIFNCSLPFVVSTIFVDYSEYEKNRGGKLGVLAKILGGDNLEYVKAIGRLLKNGNRINSLFYLFRGHRASIRLVAKKAQMLLPNSHSEYNRFTDCYGISAPYLKVPNAIEAKTFADEVKPNEKYRDHILCVGRIEGRKNQLNLIRALIDTDLQLTIIGKPSPNHIEYFNECKKLVDSNVNMRIIEHIGHSELASIYKAAKVHVLPSWFETTGLSTLEAAVMDCNIVVSPKGDTVEYFGELTEYCLPDDINSIKSAVLAAYMKPIEPKLKQLILAEYTWDKAAQMTLKAYNTILYNKS